MHDSVCIDANYAASNKYEWQVRKLCLNGMVVSEIRHDVNMRGFEHKQSSNMNAIRLNEPLRYC
jgi:hypothetical protein